MSELSEFDKWYAKEMFGNDSEKFKYIKAAWLKLNALKWTSDLPTQEGWYWLREDENTRVVFVRLERELVYYEAMSEIDCCAALVEGEWYGPIAPPEYP
jgi:hypothetical protein